MTAVPPEPTFEYSPAVASQMVEGRMDAANVTDRPCKAL